MNVALEFGRRHPTVFARLLRRQYQMAQHHWCIGDALRRVEAGEVDRLLIRMPPRHGKLVADSTPVATPSGWKSHGSLRVGDQVFSSDGIPTTVEAISESDFASLEVSFTDGESIRVHPNHEWTLYNRSSGRWETWETGALMNRALWSGDRAVFQVPQQVAIQFPSATLQVPPYVLGAWLGDGTSSKPWITHAPQDIVVPEAFVTAGYPIHQTYTHRTTGVVSTVFDGLWSQLLSLGVAKNKHIPLQYLHSDVTQRLELLAGLIDTDGYVNQNDHRVTFVNTNERLVDDVIELVRSLGWRVAHEVQAPRTSTSGFIGKQSVHYLRFSPDRNIPTRLPRKSVVAFSPKQRRRGIASIKPCTPETGRCIQVSEPNGLYLVGRHLIATHNSTLASLAFPAWYLGRNPDRRIIAASYGDHLARGFGRGARNLIGQDVYRALFPGIAVARDSSAANSWEIEGRDGGYTATSVGGPITGLGAHVLLIDDPVKSREEAESQVRRDNTWDWYTSDAYTRLEDGGAIVVIMTPWHEDDLSGRLLAEQENGGDQWEVLDLPAIDEQGRALWPEKFPVEVLTRIRRTLGEYNFGALYQQRPSPVSGTVFQRGWMTHRWNADGARECRELPDGLFRFQAADTAYKTGVGNDYSVVATWGTDGQDFYLLHVWRARVEYPDLRRSMTELAERFSPRAVLIEDAASGQSIIQELRRGTGLPIIGVSAGGSKSASTDAITPVFEAGRVYLPERASWLDEWIEEHISFPRGTHDDQVRTTDIALNWAVGRQRSRQTVSVTVDNGRPEPRQTFWQKKRGRETLSAPRKESPRVR